MVRLALASVLVASAGAADTLYAPALARLPVGAIQPEGWLKAEAELMVAGSTGGLGFWPGGGIAESKWLVGKTTNGEEQGGEYYMNGLIPLTCQVDAPALRELREASVSKILAHVGANGTLGGEIPAGKYSDKSSYWGRMIIVLALESYAECEGPYAPAKADQDAVVAALVRHHKAIYSRIAAKDPPFVHNPWGYARYDEILLGVQWLVDRGETDPDLWALMRIVRAQGDAVIPWEDFWVSGDPYNPPSDVHCWPNKSDPTEKNFMVHHGVNIMEAIKTGASWYRVSGDEKDRASAAAALRFIDKWERSADGTFTAPDCFAQEPHEPSNGVETCSVVEEMYSLRTSYEVDGNVSLYDRLEWVAFNAMPATTNPTFTGNAYYHEVNQVVMNGKSGYGMNGCCTGNVHQGWPKFIMSGVAVETATSTAVVAGYAPYAATLPDGARVTTGGSYPFADEATVAVERTASDAPFGLKLRIPCWARSATVAVDGGKTYTAPPCAFFVVPGVDASTTAWKATVAFEHVVEVVENAWKTPKGAVEIKRGPLLYTFPVPGRVVMKELNGTRVEDTRVVVDDTKVWQIALKAPSPETLTFSGFKPLHSRVPFSRDAPPATIAATARETVNCKGYDKGRVPPSPITAKNVNGTDFTVHLVPLAHSFLRITVLPVLAADL